MKIPNLTATKKKKIGLALLGWMLISGVSSAADHNDPNAINSIFSDIPISPADLYDMFGFPSENKTDGEKVVAALTFAAIPKAGVFDPDLLYRIQFDPDPRIGPSMGNEVSLSALFDYAKAVGKKYVNFKPSEVRVTFNKDNQAKVDFIGFPGGDFSKVIDTNKVVDIKSTDGNTIKAFIGGRDDAFFNDLPGFFRSINYAPQFYHVPNAMKDKRELPIPKTLIELEGNTLFNFDKNDPDLGIKVKKDLPKGPLTWNGNKFLKDEKGNFRFVYSGIDAQAGRNINAIVLEMPLKLLTKTPETDRIVRTWGESWVLKASAKAKAIPDQKELSFFGLFKGMKATSPAEAGFNDDISDYKKVDLDGVPFLDAALNERADDRQLANNIKLSEHYVTRFAHLGWGFGPSISALGLGTCFDHSNSPISVHKTYKLAIEAFPRAKKCFFQRVNMPDNSWNVKGLDIKPPRTFEIFIPNVASIDMDTNGTWPFGRRFEDQVATRFLSLFLDMEKGCGGKPCNVETLGSQALWDSAPIFPKTPPNPLRNDKEFLKEFPYLAEPW
ncbi:hypothetical protein [Methylomicrobium sp. Wu6]|uniref:DUF4331 family protein n=1 Tax=Methylomicrobium sp. Wu6 TaxID=3107928 RepID=UPI002DD6B284|nr:hypothetical protein [Methylomicrobium sp. Wu6]MEC4748945.1 DUF4331 family protein [Methylomicrobium sp. Wu6]